MAVLKNWREKKHLMDLLSKRIKKAYGFNSITPEQLLILKKEIRAKKLEEDRRLKDITRFMNKSN